MKRALVIMCVTVLLAFSGAQADIIAGTGAVGTWTAVDWNNSASVGLPIGQNIVVSAPTGGGVWGVDSVNVLLFNRFPGWYATNGVVTAHLIAGTMGTTYVDNKASAVASFSGDLGLTDPGNPLNGQPGLQNLELVFTSFANPDQSIAAGSYYLEFDNGPFSEGQGQWILYGRRDGGTNVYADGGSWALSSESSAYVNADYDMYFQLNGHVIPEPMTLGLLAVGGVLGLLKRKRS